MQLQLFANVHTSSSLNNSPDRDLGQPYTSRCSVAKKATSQRHKTYRGVCS